MEIFAIIFAVITGICLVSLQIRHAGSFRKAIFGPFDKKLMDNIDSTDKRILILAGISFLLCLIFHILSY